MEVINEESDLQMWARDETVYEHGRNADVFVLGLSIPKMVEWLETQHWENSTMKTFLICPVRGVTLEESRQIGEFVSELENRSSVYWPSRDTDQDDLIGLRICSDNRAAMIDCDQVFVWWNSESKGSIFDLGMSFALRKPIFLANRVTPTEQKSFENVLLALSK